MRGRPSRARVLAFASSMALLCVLMVPQAVAVSSTTANGGPASLALSVVPPKLPADGGSYPAVAVSLVDSTGAASVALNDTVVYLTSSQRGVGAVSPQVTIRAGEGFAVANFTTSNTPGATLISASSSGFTTASTTLTTATPTGFPTSLSVIPVPGAQLAGSTGQGTVIVESLDSGGFPAEASSAISVTLTSSDSGVVTLPTGSVSLAPGAAISSATYKVGVSSGTATISGSAPGLSTGSGVVTVIGEPPFALSIFAQPDPVATSTAGRLVVTILDRQGNPAPAPAPITVAISSSNTSVVATDPSATIPTGAVYAVASFTSQAVTGAANLTASSPGLTSDFAVVTVARPVAPAKLVLMTAPDPVPADDASYLSMVVALTDSSGGPAVASSSVSVTLASSNSAVGTVSGTLSIPSGSSYAVATFTSTYSVGGTTVTASAQNLQSATATVSSYGTVPSKVVVAAVPSVLPSGGGGYPALEVMLEDANGLPAAAPSDISVQLTSSDTGVATVGSTAVVSAGSSYALASVTTTLSPGNASVTVTAPGFAASSTGLSTVSLPPSHLGFYVAPASGIQSLGQGADAILAVQLQDATASPAVARQDTQVVVTSSNSAVLAKPVQLDIPAGADYAWTYLKAPQPGQGVLTATSNGLASADANISELALPVSITLTSSPPVVALGTTATVQLQVTVMGTPLAGVDVSLTASSGTLGVPGGVTDSAGQFTDTFTPSATGSAAVTALVQDPLLGSQATETNIIVLHSGAGGSKGLGVLGLVLPVVVVVVVVAVVALGARRILKKRISSPDEGEEGGRDPGYAGDSKK